MHVTEPRVSELVPDFYEGAVFRLYHAGDTLTPKRVNSTQLVMCAANRRF